MSFPNWLQNHRSALAPGRGQRHHRRRGSLRAASHRLNLEVLEDRWLLSFRPARLRRGHEPARGGHGRLQQRRPSRPGHGQLDDSRVPSACCWATATAASAGGAVRQRLGPESMAVGDFNGDGKLDLVTGDLDMTMVHRRAVGQRRWHLPVGPDDMRPVQNTPGRWRWAISTRDGRRTRRSPPRHGPQLELPLQRCSRRVAGPRGRGGSPSAVLTTNLASDTTVPSDGPTSTATASWTCAVARSTAVPTALGVLLGSTATAPSGRRQYFATSPWHRSVAVGPDRRRQARLLVDGAELGERAAGNGNGTFQAVQNYADGKMHTSVAVADFNGDGKRDVVTAR